MTATPPARGSVASDDDEAAIACHGWRTNRRCADVHGRQLRDPHPTCLAALHRDHLARLNEG